MKTISPLILFIILSTNAFAFGDVSYSEAEYYERQNTPMRPLMDKYQVKPEPVVEVDRHVLSAKDYQSDPSILISLPRKREAVQEDPKTRVVYVPQNPIIKYVDIKDQEPVVTTTWCDDEKEVCK